MVLAYRYRAAQMAKSQERSGVRFLQCPPVITCSILQHSTINEIPASRQRKGSVHSVQSRIKLSFILLLAAAVPATRTAQAQNVDGAAPRSQGATSAPVTVYEMADFQCPACRQFALAVLPSVERDDRARATPGS